MQSGLCSRLDAAGWHDLEITSSARPADDKARRPTIIMESLARLGLIATCLIAMFVGARTLWIWRRTRMVQELCIGANVLFIATGGLILTLLGALGTSAGQTPSVFWYTMGLLALVIHVAALYAGTWKIFRPDERWPVLVVSLGTGLACFWMASALWFLNTGEWLTARSVLLLMVRGVGLAWAGYECLRYSAMLNKRAAVGLGDPLIAHRIWLWGFAALAALLVIVLDIASWGLSGQPLAATPVGLHAMSLFGLLSISGIAFAFFPPAAYVRMIERRAAA
jgi:hypothetical protein